MLNKSIIFPCFIAACAYLILKYGVKIQDFLEIKILSPIISPSSEKLFTISELESYTGDNGGPIYLAILGNVFDVSSGRKHYEQGGSYSFFAGKDASKAFVTGDFSSLGLTDDVSELSLRDLGDLRDWLQMYRKDYVFKGKLIGRFYESNGSPTPLLMSIEEKFIHLDTQKKAVDEYKVRYPPCNVEWTPENGSKFWCSKQSGGIDRNWVGVPRKFYEPGSSKFRCACVNPTEKILDGKFVPYEECNPSSSICYVK